MDVRKIRLSRDCGLKEYWVLGFIERSSGRIRAYFIPNTRIDTMAFYIVKTVALKSTVYTPFYEHVGWECLDKYYKHKRLTPNMLVATTASKKGKATTSESNAVQNKYFQRTSGFDTLWEDIGSLEFTFKKIGELNRRLGRVRENLQMHLDEKMW